jgi:hypothetical protein
MRIRLFVVVLAAWLPLQVFGQTSNLGCTIGPIIKTFGGSDWIVASCVDDRTLTLWPVKGEPSFIRVVPTPEGYAVDGRGRSDNVAMRAAVHELAKLSVAEIRALVAETKQNRITSHHVPAKAKMDCSTGPVTKRFGGTSWLVRSCDDEALVILADPENPAFPFYFFVYPSETEKGRFMIDGEGTGNKQASEAALAEIRLLPATALAALIAETKQQKK